VSLAAKNKQFWLPCGTARGGAGSDTLPLSRGLCKRLSAFSVASHTTEGMNFGSAAEDVVLVSLLFLIPLRTCVLKYIDYQK